MKYELPSLSELHQTPEVAFKNDQLQFLLHQPPHKDWVKRHPMVKVKNAQGQMEQLEYLPIDKVKLLLTRIFQDWDSEILRVQQLFNAVVVTVRLHYTNPITGKACYKDGVGAVGVQTDKDAKASDINAIKYDAVMKAAPAAESYAIKNAAEKIGNIFGASLGKFDIAEFKSMYMTDKISKEDEAIPDFPM